VSLKVPLLFGHVLALLFILCTSYFILHVSLALLSPSACFTLHASHFMLHTLYFSTRCVAPTMLRRFAPSAAATAAAAFTEHRSTISCYRLLQKRGGQAVFIPYT